MPRNDTFLADFKRSILKKYNPQKIIAGRSNNLTEAFTRGVTGFTGNGSDGRLQADAPAGIVHEGEVVTSAPDVAAAGGPEALQVGIEKQITRENPDIPSFRRGGLVPASTKRVGYQEGGVAELNPVVTQSSSSVTLPSQKIEGLNPVETTLQSKDINATGEVVGTTFEKKEGDTVVSTSKTGVSANVSEPAIDIDIPEVRDVETIDKEPILDKLQIEDSPRAKEFQTLQDEQIGELQLIASGEGAASTLIGNLARDRLAGQLAAGNQAALQASAQLGITGGELNVFRARQRRDTALAQTGLEGQLAIDAVNRAENAVFKLADIAAQGQAFEEAKAEFGANFDLSKAQFGLTIDKFNEFKLQFADTMGINVAQLGLDVDKTNELIRQFNENMDFNWEKLAVNMDQFDQTTALTMFLNNSKVLSGMAETLILAGQPTAAQAIWNTMGHDVDLSGIQDKEDRATYGDLMADYSLDLADMPLDTVYSEDGVITDEALNFASTKNSIDRWNLQHKGEPGFEEVTRANANSNEAFVTWSSNEFKNVLLKNDPVYWMIESGYSDPTKESIILSVQEIDPNTGEPVPVYTKSDDGRFLDKDGNEFTYNGKTGLEGVDLALSQFLGPGGGLTMDASGNIYMGSGGLIVGDDPTPLTVDQQIKISLPVLEGLVTAGTEPTSKQIVDSFVEKEVVDFPDPSEVENFLKDNTTGGWMNINGEAVKVIRDVGPVPIDDGTSTRARTIILEYEGQEYLYHPLPDGSIRWYTPNEDGTYKKLSSEEEPNFIKK